jgi:hypothetical protein
MAIVGDEEKDVTFNIMCDGGPCSGGSSVFQENTQVAATRFCRGAVVLPGFAMLQGHDLGCWH